MQTRTDFDLCYVISHGFAARMLLQTGLILQLADSGKRIAIITPDAGDDNLLALRDHPGISVFSSPIRLSLWDDDYGFKRRYFMEDLRANPVFWEKHIHALLYSKSRHPWKRIRPLYYYLIYGLIPYFPSIRRRFARTENKYLESGKIEQLLARIAPKVVISTYPINFLEAKVLYAAKKQGIATVIHLLSWDNITSKGIFPVVADHFILWGPVMYEELKEYYNIPDERIHICGVPHFDHHLRIKQQGGHEDLIRQLGLDPDRPYLLVAMSSPRFAPYEIEIVEWLARAIREGSFGEGLQLVVRPHPQNTQGALADKSWIGRLDRLGGDGVAIDYPQLNKSKVRWSMKSGDMDHLSQLLAGCRVCLNSGSTVSIDALVMGRPVILTSFDGDRQLRYWKSARRLIDYIHLKKFIGLGGAEVVHSYAQLSESISRYLQYPEHRLEQRRKALQAECYRNDGQATQRVIKAIHTIYSGARSSTIDLTETTGVQGK